MADAVSPRKTIVRGRSRTTQSALKLLRILDEGHFPFEETRPVLHGDVRQQRGPALSLSVVRDVLASRPGVWAVVDASGEFFPAAAWGWGIPLERTVVIRPRSDEDIAWAVEHCLRSPAVAVTWCHVGGQADRWLRRWKRAVEIGGGLGVLFRSEQSSTGTGVDQRWHSRGGQQDLAGRTVEVGLDYCRGFHEGTFHVQVCDAEGSLTLVPQLAHTATLERAAGA